MPCSFFVPTTHCLFFCLFKSRLPSSLHHFIMRIPSAASTHPASANPESTKQVQRAHIPASRQPIPKWRQVPARMTSPHSSHKHHTPWERINASGGGDVVWHARTDIKRRAISPKITRHNRATFTSATGNRMQIWISPP